MLTKTEFYLTSLQITFCIIVHIIIVNTISHQLLQGRVVGWEAGSQPPCLQKCLTQRSSHSKEVASFLPELPYLAMSDSEVMRSPLALLQDALAHIWDLLGWKSQHEELQRWISRDFKSAYIKQEKNVKLLIMKSLLSTPHPPAPHSFATRFLLFPTWEAGELEEKQPSA